LTASVEDGTKGEAEAHTFLFHTERVMFLWHWIADAICLSVLANRFEFQIHNDGGMYAA
jgi:hypothetical protein